jgi:hypothetical protein
MKRRPRLRYTKERLTLLWDRWQQGDVNRPWKNAYLFLLLFFM